MAAQTQTVAADKETAPVSVWIGPVIAAWVIPGGGHFLLKRTGRGALIFASEVRALLAGGCALRLR